MKENNKNQSSEQVQRTTSEQVQRLTKEERETACVYNEADGYWTIYTGVNRFLEKEL